MPAQATLAEFVQSSVDPNTGKIHEIDYFRAEFRFAQEQLESVERVFVVGCGKSGTTWMQNLLNGHPHIAMSGEVCALDSRSGERLWSFGQ